MNLIRSPLGIPRRFNQEATCSSLGKVADLDLYNRLSGNLRRILESLGLERKARDVTPSLQSYLQAKATHGE